MSAVRSFTYEPHPVRTVFGAGARGRVHEELERLKLSRVVLVASPRLAAELTSALGSARIAKALTDVVMHVPGELADAAVAAALEAQADGVVAAGGGSAIGLAKAIALSTGLPIIALPTTYAGSEMTSIWGRTEAGIKKTGRDPRVRPRTVIYDPQLLETLPRKIAGPSGLNAMAHAMETLYAPDLDPITELLAEESARALAEHLPRAVESGDAAAIAGALYGAWLAGTCLDRAAMGVHHKLCHVLGGTFNLDHASVHAVILPHAAAFNREHAPAAMKRLARALSTDDASRGLRELARRVGAPLSLSELGLKPDDLDRAADLATRSPYPNPRPIDRSGIRALLDAAFTPT